MGLQSEEVGVGLGDGGPGTGGLIISTFFLEREGRASQTAAELHKQGLRVGEAAASSGALRVWGGGSQDIGRAMGCEWGSQSQGLF